MTDLTITDEDWSVLKDNAKSRRWVVQTPDGDITTVCQDDALRAIAKMRGERDAWKQARGETEVTLAEVVRQRDEAYLKRSDMYAENTRLRSLLERAGEVLEPFADFGRENTDEVGWSEGAVRNDRICDWFGPSNLRSASSLHVEIEKVFCVSQELTTADAVDVPSTPEQDSATEACRACGGKTWDGLQCRLCGSYNAFPLKQGEG